MEFFERLTQERKRLNLSQASFAKAVGASLSSQKLYESGAREPNVSYLKALDAIGVDVFFLLHGDTSGEIRHEILGIGQTKYSPNGYRNAALGVLLNSLGVDQEAWNKSLDRIIPITVEVNSNPYNKLPSVLFDATGSTICAALASELIRLSPVLSDKINESSEVSLSIISDIVEGLETVARTSGKDMQPAKKAQAVVMLYRAFKASGKIDQKMIDEVVTLASG
jgi:transcriptional regulator with XRE-family HTH domain